MSHLHAAAHQLAQAGCSVVPVTTDGKKTPAVAWKTYQTTPATTAQLDTWFTGGHYDGIGIICGHVSGNLEMLEVEGRALHLVEQLATLMADNGYADLWKSLCGGYLEQSPSGGMHWLYRVDGQPRGNTKLARRPCTDGPGVDVLIETRGEGGYVVVAPSAGRTHPTGRPWTMLTGGPSSIPTITVDERDALHAIATMLDQMPIPEPTEHPTGPDLLTPAGGLRPGDDYNQRATWHDILTAHGWQRTKTFGTRGYGWTRPGKSARDGISATTGTSSDGADRLYVFSSSTDFDTERPYSKFAAYTLLEHAGDHSAAARQLRADGYGTPPPEPTTPTPITPPAPAPGRPQLSVVDGGQDGTAALKPAPTATLERSEDGHAHQLIDTYGDLIRYCPQRAAWLAWDGTVWRWQPKGGGIVREYTKTVARAFPQTDQAAVSHKKRALSANGVTGALTQASTDHRITIDLGDLDANPWILNTPAGVINLRTGNLQPPDPTNLCTKITTAAPDFTNRDTTWETFLNDTFGNDTQLRTYVQRLFGITLIGSVLEQLLAFLHGLGANGKSTLVEAFMHALGVGESGYATAAPAEMLMIRKHSEHPAELAQLAGARLVVCSELDDGQRFAEAKIKQLTGRDSINARFLYGQPFTFTPTHTIWLLGNHRPQARTGGMAFWRRVKLIEFRHVVPPDKLDPALADKLNAAAGAILAWAIQGAVDYQHGGIREPTGVSEATEAYAADQDTIGRFVADQVHLCPGVDAARVAISDLRQAYERWCTETGETPAGPKRLTQELRDRFDIGDVKGNKGRRFYTGLTLLASEEDDGSEDAREWFK